MNNINDIQNEIESISISSSHQCTPEECQHLVNHDRKSFKVLHLNIRSIECNIDKAKILLTRLNFTCDVIIFSECWLSKSINTPNLVGYTAHRSGYKNQNDGVIIYVNSSLDYTITEPSLIDASALLLTCLNSIAIVAVYRSPSVNDAQNFIDSLNTVLESLSGFKTVSIIGDININISPDSMDKNLNDYLNTTASHALLPAYTLPTRNYACLDHVMLKTNTKASTYILDSIITDHFPVLLCVSLHNKILIKPDKNIIRINFSSVISHLRTVDFSNVLSIKDANIAADAMVMTIVDIIKKYTIVVPISRRQTPIKPWITPGLVKCIRNRDKLYKKFKKDSDNLINKIIYLRYRNFCNNLLKRLKKEYEIKIFKEAKGNPKATWEAVKKVANIQQKVNPSKNLLNTNINPSSSINDINKFFANVGKSYANKIKNNSNSIEDKNLLNNSGFDASKNFINSMALYETDCSEVDKIMTSIKPDSAVGWDGIPVKVLLQTRDVIVPPLTHIFNLCLSTGTFPKPFKKALVHPIFKSGDRDSVNNYRPISVLPVFSKILEKLLLHRLINYLDKSNIISNNQYGFRKGISTEDAVIGLTNNIVNLIDNKFKTIGIFLDISKAFDTVSIPRLLLKMERIGIRGMVLKLFHEYLTDRTQCVKIDSYVSTDEYLTFGVPQGSILGPTLFLLYINDLCNLQLPNCSIFTYADDTALVVSGKTWLEAKRIGEEALSTVLKWLANNILTINIDKTCYVTFSTNKISQPNSLFSLIAHKCTPFNSCDCPTLKRSDHVKYLGVFIDSLLNWKVQINTITARSRKLIYVFKKLSAVADLETQKLVYYSLAQSIFNYCSPVWGGACLTYCLQLERAQRAILKIMGRKPIYFSTYLLYQELKILSIRQLFILATVLRKHKSLEYDSNLDATSRRKSQVLIMKITRTRLASRHYEKNCCRLYNKLNNILDIYPLTRNQAKIRIINYLQKLNYEETENLLKPSL